MHEPQPWKISHDRQGGLISLGELRLSSGCGFFFPFLWEKMFQANLILGCFPPFIPFFIRVSPRPEIKGMNLLHSILAYLSSAPGCLLALPPMASLSSLSVENAVSWSSFCLPYPFVTLLSCVRAYDLGKAQADRATPRVVGCEWLHAFGLWYWALFSYWGWIRPRCVIPVCLVRANTRLISIK